MEKTPLIIYDINDLKSNRELWRISLGSLTNPFVSFQHIGDYVVENRAFCLIQSGNVRRPIAESIIFKNGEFIYGSIEQVMFMDRESAIIALDEMRAAATSAYRAEPGLFDDASWLKSFLDKHDVRINLLP